MFHTNVRALDIFGDKQTSDARRRCRPADEDEDAQLLYDLHLRVGVVYVIVYASTLFMPFCTQELEAVMEARGHPLSLIMQEDSSIDTPWGLAKAYVTEAMAYMVKNDGWNADGSQSRDFHRIPFSDYATKDSAGNTWTPYHPQNSPYKVETAPTMYCNGTRHEAYQPGFWPCQHRSIPCKGLYYVKYIVGYTTVCTR